VLACVVLVCGVVVIDRIFMYELGTPHVLAMLPASRCGTAALAAKAAADGVVIDRPPTNTFAEMVATSLTVMFEI
jgi:hypothetical protein